MLWITLSFAFVGLWAMLSVFSGEHRRQTNELKAIEMIEAEAANKKTPTA
jgi:hypothetical protein